MKVKQYKSGKLGSTEIDVAGFGDRVLYRTLKDAVDMYQQNLRQGTVKTKTRAEVAYARKKMWKQKHTGRARSGDRKNPIWRGGGTIFGPLPRDWSYHMPVKARRVALRSALAGKLADSEVIVTDLPKLSAPSSKTARKLLADCGNPRRALVVLAAANPMVWKSFRNFPGVHVRVAAEINALDVAKVDLLIAETGVLALLQARVGAAPKQAPKQEGAA